MLAIGIELFKQIDMNLLTVLVLAVLLYAIRLQTDTGQHPESSSLP